MRYGRLFFLFCLFLIDASKSYGTDMSAAHQEGKDFAGRLILEGPKSPTTEVLPGFAGTDTPESKLRVDELESLAKERLEIARNQMRENEGRSRNDQSVSPETALLTSFYHKPDERIDDAAPFMKLSNEVASDPYKTLNAEKDTIQSEMITKTWQETCTEPAQEFFMEDTSYLTHVSVVEKKQERAGVSLVFVCDSKVTDAVFLYVKCSRESVRYKNYVEYTRNNGGYLSQDTYKHIKENLSGDGLSSSDLESDNPLFPETTGYIKPWVIYVPFLNKYLRNVQFEGLPLAIFDDARHPSSKKIPELQHTNIFIKNFKTSEEMKQYLRTFDGYFKREFSSEYSRNDLCESLFQEAEQIKYYRRVIRVPVRPSLGDHGFEEAWVETSKEDFDKGPEDLGEGADIWSLHNDFYETYVDAGVCTYDVASCTEGEGTRSLANLPIRRACWAKKKRYHCQDKGPNTCDHLRRQGCLQRAATCLRKIGDHCVFYAKDFECSARIDTGRKTRIKGTLPFCIDGKCHEINWLPNTDMADTLAKFAMLNEMSKDLDGKAQTVFKGESIGCSTHLMNFSSCCGRSSGWGASIGLSKCSEEERRLSKLREQNKCVLTGTYCAEKKLGVCIRKKTNFCCFASKLARIFHEQARPQLGMTFGSAKSPLCQGLSFTQIATLDYKKLDLKELFDDLMSKVKHPSIESTKEKFEAQWKARLPDRVNASSPSLSTPQMTDHIEARKSTLQNRSGNFTLHSEHDSRDLATPDISDGSHEKAKLVF